MKTPWLIVCSVGSMAIALAAEDTSVVPTIESVGLFKNGLAVVRASFPVKGPGIYRWDKVPRVIHGSFWVESEGTLSVQATVRAVEKTDEATAGNIDLQTELAGQDVAVTLKSNGTAPSQFLTGKVRANPAVTPTKSWDTDFSSLGAANPYRNFRSSNDLPNPGPPAFLVLQDEAGGRRYVDRSSIASVSVNGPFTAAKHFVEQPVLLFDVRQIPADGAAVRVTYLTKGLAWMPSYQVDLTDPTKLRIRQNAVVRNEMDDLGDTEIQLISGYPNVRFGSVDSPLSPGTGLAAFFQQINQSSSASGNAALSNAMSQQVVYSNSGSSNASIPLTPVAEEGNSSDDMHYENIGNRSLKAGDSLSLDIAAMQTPYERVVEWAVPDPRDANGRYQRNNGSERIPDEGPWDAVKFSNPFKFPMTTGSAIIVEAGKFRGQSQSEWVNPGQGTCLRITRALSVRTEAAEVEEESQREMTWIGGNDYQRTKVKGRLALQNFRGKEATVTIRCEFSGELLEADGEPAKSLRTEGVSSVNPRRQLNWTVKLAAGEEKILNYRYQVLVDR